jgi:hypothetical protein
MPMRDKAAEQEQHSGPKIGKGDRKTNTAMNPNK